MAKKKVHRKHAKAKRVHKKKSRSPSRKSKDSKIKKLLRHLHSKKKRR